MDQEPHVTADLEFSFCDTWIFQDAPFQFSACPCNDNSQISWQTESAGVAVNFLSRTALLRDSFHEIYWGNPSLDAVKTLFQITKVDAEQIVGKFGGSWFSFHVQFASVDHGNLVQELCKVSWVCRQMASRARPSDVHVNQLHCMVDYQCANVLMQTTNRIQESFLSEISAFHAMEWKRPFFYSGLWSKALPYFLRENKEDEGPFIGRQFTHRNVIEETTNQTNGIRHRHQRGKYRQRRQLCHTQPVCLTSHHVHEGICSTMANRDLECLVLKSWMAWLGRRGKLYSSQTSVRSSALRVNRNELGFC